MDRAKAIEILRGMVKDRIGTDDLDTTIRMANEKDAVEMAITDMKSCSHANREWISVKDRLPPKDDTKVLTYGNPVTHWMPLPEPPEGLE